MIEDIRNLIDQYGRWLRDKTILKQIDDWVEITTPYLDRHNDHLQIYARKENGHIIISDDGYTISDLEISGCAIDTPKRIQLLKEVLNGHGVKQSQNKALVVEATPETFPAKKHSLIQAMLAINDLYYASQARVESLFYEDVIKWLDENDVRYTPRVKFTGQSGFDYLFDFVIPKSRNMPERVAQTISNPSRASTEKFIFAWSDTKEIRPDDSRPYALLNDSQRTISEDVLSALKSYEINPIPWSERQRALDEFVK